MPQRMTSFGLSGRSNREKLIAKTTVANAITTHQEHYGYGFNLQGDGKLRYYGMRAAHQAEMARFVYTSSDTS